MAPPLEEAYKEPREDAPQAAGSLMRKEIFAHRKGSILPEYKAEDSHTSYLPFL